MNYTIATNWNGLNDWQLAKVASLLFGGYSDKRIKHGLVYILFTGKKSLWKYFKIRYLIARVPFNELYRYTEFLNTSIGRTDFPKYLKLGFIKLYGPSSRMSNLTIDQFSIADVFYYRWCRTRDSKELNRLVSILYSPKGQEFSREDLGHSIYVKLMPKDKKLAVVLAYMGSRKLLTDSFTYVFKNSKESGGSSYNSFDKIVFNMARSDNQPFGHLYTTKEANVYDFMNILNDELADQQEFKRNNG
ncbi:hypothetical protein AWE51_00270 [Aquimarina aggregata]|uniref:Uncharacterized protein n=1 Tax=Aquimarina aggregata TaxID=1642818 RepID=A0A163BZC0_9FLAO|nr:hypothetical protein [Aquimarina aggregata]KZS41916.1 hypothetical protein AWE51_00270 [Aquimarina aggregata]